ncbi:EAL domain-containing protein [uncultured Methylophaga sp.]|uniref:EAL domain-containing protein n=1 Tax=uncultured Methylophaga sp. TaxID=285271 RepID=UPI002617843E|nr:EAL domain-containing protein [uncultured Methylophaga sp.]
MFKRWSIKNLLQFWAAATVVVVMLMALMTNHANMLIGDIRDIVATQVLPLESSGRQLSHTTMALAQRQQQLLASDMMTTLAQYDQRAVLEQRFQQNWLRLASLVDDEPEHRELVDSLYSYYQDFLNLDDELRERKQNVLGLNARLNQHSSDIEVQSGQLQQQLEQLEQRLREDKRVGLLEILEPIQIAVYQLSLLNYQSLTLNRDSQLEQIISRQLAPIKSQLGSQSQKLQQATENLPGIATMSSQLRYDIEVLIALFEGQDGLMDIHQQRLLQLALLEQGEESALSVMSVMVDKLNQVAALINQQLLDAVSDNVVKADSNRWSILALSLLLTGGMILFAWLLLRAVNRPLGVIRRSIHALSEGRFDTRIPPSPSSNELSLLASDFNLFAEKTEQMIDALSDARLSLQQREQHIRAIINGVPEAILTLSSSGTIVDINPAAEQVLAGSMDSLCGKNLLDIFEQQGFDSIDDLAQKAGVHGEFEGRRLDGSSLSMWLSLSRIDKIEGQVWVCVISDVTAWKQTDLKLQQLMAEQEAILENAIIGIAFVRERRFIRVNRRFEDLFGFDRDQITNQSTRSIYPNEQAYLQFGDQSYQALASSESYEAQLELIRQDGGKFWCALSGKAIDPNDPIAGTIWLFEDVTQQRENEEYLTRLASIDSLTGLPNRNVFNDRVEHAIHKAQRDGRRLAVFFLDLDHFKHINDSLGHNTGDMLLREVARRIKACLREGDTVARLGGDEFTLLLEDISSAEHVGKVAEKVIHSMTRPYKIESTEISVSPSIGISLYPADGRDVDMLVRNADAAMYHAKKQGRNNFQFYSLDMNAEAAERLALETALRQAVVQQEFFLHYQPQFDLDNGEMIGAEVLLRWYSEVWGNVPPSRFVPVLEDTGLIGEVGEWILGQACDTFLAIQDQVSTDFKIAVNLSGRQFKGGLLLGHIRQLLNQRQMPASNLELEITETMLMEDTELATMTLQELSDMGLSLAIDDFGTGYSSLSYLKQFPLNVLKIDSAFIHDITTDQDDAAIVDAIMAMSASLGLTVVAEGVETEAQLDYLRQRHCQRAQGYLLGRPVDKAAFMALTENKVRVGD